MTWLKYHCSGSEEDPPLSPYMEDLRWHLLGGAGTELLLPTRRASHTANSVLTPLPLTWAQASYWGMAGDGAELHAEVLAN